VLYVSANIAYLACALKEETTASGRVVCRFLFLFRIFILLTDIFFALGRLSRPSQLSITSAEGTSRGMTLGAFHGQPIMP